MAISGELLNILVCPQCKGGIELTGDGTWLACKECRLRYPIRNDIPVMLIDEAETVSAE